MIEIILRQIFRARIRKRLSSLGKGTTIDKSVQFHKGNAKIHVGTNCFIAQGCLFSIRKSGLVIGDNVMIAPRCMFFDWNHVVDPASIDIREMSKHLLSKGVININDGVWIGAGVIVLSGVEIGKGSVVGSGSVVTRSVPPYAVVAGNPARIIRYRDAH